MSTDALIVCSLLVTAVNVDIEFEAGTSTFRVRCTSTGGRALNMTGSGPNGYNSDLSSYIQPVGSRRFRGSDMYTASIDVAPRDGGVYQCNVTSVDSRTDNVTVRGEGVILY